MTKAPTQPPVAFLSTPGTGLRALPNGLRTTGVDHEGKYRNELDRSAAEPVSMKQ
jgi:hypothetical protein